ncbi:hypothetical protein MIND_01194500 [Mycena indigotica]|uniref:Uncharacterized protein n=1 Tax=Mycena indigotica TaxID=2126181 RepID=A0A8H6VWQ4_9AGAR|nr:uncharacterized protein MIND_01194500 [Mycena indigotica]KAF7292953.1 hypothetical protein MIND_01194500 [Mycena indigotica]
MKTPSTSLSTSETSTLPPLSHNPYGNLPVKPQPFTRRLPQPTPADKLEPPPLLQEAKSRSRSKSRHRDEPSATEGRSKSRSRDGRHDQSGGHRSRSRSKADPSRNRDPSAFEAPPPMPSLPPIYKPQPSQSYASSNVSNATYYGNEGGYKTVASSNAYYSPAGYPDVKNGPHDPEATDTPIVGGLKHYRELLEREERERWESEKQRKRSKRRSRSVGDFANYRTGDELCAEPVIMTQSPYQEPQTRTSSKTKTHKRHVEAAPESRTSQRSRRDLAAPQPLQLEKSNGKTEIKNTFSKTLDENTLGLSAHNQDQHFHQREAKVSAANAQPLPYGQYYVSATDPHSNLYAQQNPYANPIYNPMMAASSASLYYAQPRYYGENAPPMPQVPVEYRQKRRGFFKRLVDKAF